jgi:hypothetical protein
MLALKCKFTLLLTSREWKDVGVPVTFRYDLFCHWLRGFRNRRETCEAERPDGSVKCPAGHKAEKT